MSVVDDRRIEDLEQLARSLTTRVDRLERAAVREQHPAPARARTERSSLPTISLSTPPALREPIEVQDSRQRFEDLLGGRMLAWLGGLAVVIGIALFFAYAISRGWIGEAARVTVGGAASLGLLCLGVWLHERRGRTEAARTVVAVAVAGLLITVVVASRVYAVIPVAAGVALALAVGATAAALAVRWNARVIAAIGIIGALLAPAMLGAPEDGATLVVLFATALSALAVLLWRRWDWLGFAVLLVCAPRWLVWLSNGPSLAAGLLVLLAFGTLGHLAAIGFELRLPESKLRPSSSLLLALNAGMVALAGYAALVDLGHPVAAGLWIAALAAAHLLLALLAGRLTRVSTEIRLLLTALGVVLGDVAFALLAHGPVLALGFAAAGVVFARLSARYPDQLRGRALAEFGLGGHTAAALVVALSQATSLGILGQGPDNRVAATITLAGVAAASFTSARLTRASNQVWRIVLDALGLGLIAYLTAITFAGPELVLAWALEGVALAGIAARCEDDVAGVAALAFLIGAAGHALVTEAPPRAFVFGVPDLWPAAIAVGACAVASVLIARTRMALRGRMVARPLIASAALALPYLASIAIVSAFQPSAIEYGSAILQIGVRQEGQMLLSLLWAVSGVGALILGLRGDRRLLRRGALGLLLLTAGKVFLYDLSTLDSGYRIGSLIAFGLLLLLGAYGYQRLRPPAATLL
jgi:uncharacterized membrane protein